MNRILNKQYEDQFIRKTIIYGEPMVAHGYAYADSALTEKLDAKTLEELYQKGAIIMRSDGQYTPSSFTLQNGVGSLNFVALDGNIVFIGQLVSSEHSGE